MPLPSSPDGGAGPSPTGPDAHDADRGDAGAPRPDVDQPPVPELTELERKLAWRRRLEIALGRRAP